MWERLGDRIEDYVFEASRMMIEALTGANPFTSETFLLLGLRRRTPAPPPFSSMNSTPRGLLRLGELQRCVRSGYREVSSSATSARRIVCNARPEASERGLLRSI